MGLTLFSQMVLPLRKQSLMCMCMCFLVGKMMQSKIFGLKRQAILIKRRMQLWQSLELLLLSREILNLMQKIAASICPLSKILLIEWQEHHLIQRLGCFPLLLRHMDMRLPTKALWLRL